MFVHAYSQAIRGYHIPELQPHSQIYIAPEAIPKPIKITDTRPPCAYWPQHKYRTGATIYIGANRTHTLARSRTDDHSDDAVFDVAIRARDTLGHCDVVFRA